MVVIEIMKNTMEVMGHGADHRVEFKYSIGGDNKMNSKY